MARPTVNQEAIPDPNWLVGFVDAEGCFYVNVKVSKSKVGSQVLLAFSIFQHSRDALLLNSIVNYLSCGKLNTPSTRPNQTELVVYKLSDVCDKIITLFTTYPLQGIKLLYYKDFCKIAFLMANKSHLTSEGLEVIRLIKSGMNTGREQK